MNAIAKSEKLLSTGRVMVTYVAGDSVVAFVVGDTTLHKVTHDPGAGWQCDCECWSRWCSHVRSVQSITTASPAFRRHA